LSTGGELLSFREVALETIKSARRAGINHIVLTLPEAESLLALTLHLGLFLVTDEFGVINAILAVGGFTERGLLALSAS